MQRSKSEIFWPVLVLVATIDFCTKALAVNRLPLPHVPHEVYGNWIRFSLVYNPGAAFGLHLGQYSRWIFMGLTFIALLILGRLYATTRSTDVLRIVSLALVCGGAVGNVVDRIRSVEGVVDFIDIGMGNARWPTFNVADMAVSVGAFLLAWVLWGEDARAQAQAASRPTAPPAGAEAGAGAGVAGESRELS